MEWAMEGRSAAGLARGAQSAEVGEVRVTLSRGDLGQPRLVFFSGRRQHTRSKRDWSSDVCSSDLPTTWRRTWRLLLVFLTGWWSSLTRSSPTTGPWDAPHAGAGSGRGWSFRTSGPPRAWEAAADRKSVV